jgi:lysozyme
MNLLLLRNHINTKLKDIRKGKDKIALHNTAIKELSKFIKRDIELYFNEILNSIEDVFNKDMEIFYNEEDRNVIEMLVKHEGLKLFPYKDTVNKVTIGIGRNLDDLGILEEEAYFLLKNDIERVKKELLDNLGDIYNTLPIDKRNVLINMCFNLGVVRLLTFKKMLTALGEKDYGRVSEEMLNSKWATQVGRRAIELAEIMKKEE